MIPETEAELVKEYNAWLKEQKLPLGSAEEVMMSGKCSSAQWHWLKKFIDRWEEMLHYFNIGRDFSRTPGPRYMSEGSFSGEELRKKLVSRLKGALAGSRIFTIDLDGTAGYGIGFLEELFGGLIRHEGFDYSDQLMWWLEIKSLEEPYLIEDIHRYMLEAELAKAKSR